VTKEYQGWTNYETWAVNLWLDNEEGSQRYWTRAAEDALEEATDDGDPEMQETYRSKAVSALANRLQEEIEEGMPDLGCTLWSDLLSAAVSEVDWYEIALSWIEGLS
jgi:hypothetical protein